MKTRLLLAVAIWVLFASLGNAQDLPPGCIRAPKDPKVILCPDRLFGVPYGPGSSPVPDIPGNEGYILQRNRFWDEEVSARTAETQRRLLEQQRALLETYRPTTPLEAFDPGAAFSARPQRYYTPRPSVPGYRPPTRPQRSALPPLLRRATPTPILVPEPPVSGTIWRAGNTSFYNYDNGLSGSSQQLGNTAFYNFNDGLSGTAQRLGNSTFYNFSSGLSGMSQGIGNTTLYNFLKLIFIVCYSSSFSS